MPTHIAHQKDKKIIKIFAVEEKKLKEEKRWLWDKLHRIFTIHYSEVDFLTGSYFTKVLKSTIDAVLEEEEAEAQEKHCQITLK
jgi:hypothetical protein